MKHLTLKEVLYFHDLILKKSKGIKGIKDRNLLISALDSPFQTFGSDELYPSDTDKISVVVFSFMKGHVMNDANKRLGSILLLILCEDCGIRLKYKNIELEELALGVADGTIPRSGIVKWIKNHKK